MFWTFFFNLVALMPDSFWYCALIDEHFKSISYSQQFNWIGTWSILPVLSGRATKNWQSCNFCRQRKTETNAIVGDYYYIIRSVSVYLGFLSAHWFGGCILLWKKKFLHFWFWMEKKFILIIMHCCNNGINSAIST